jgi:uncharacterized damage-inducible protein DinB
MKQQLLNAWSINQNMNTLLIKNTSDAGMQKTLSLRGGRTIFLQWVHIHNVRMQWLEIAARDIFQLYKTLPKEVQYDKKMLLETLEGSSNGLQALFERSWEEGGKVKGFKKGLIPLLGYFISHESHHRGNMLLTLKQSGEKVPDVVKWGLWEWGN